MRGHSEKTRRILQSFQVGALPESYSLIRQGTKNKNIEDYCFWDRTLWPVVHIYR
jgi:hypothetical protein